MSNASNGEYRPAGLHLLADMHGVAADTLSDAVVIESVLVQSAQAAGAHVLHANFHSFGSDKGVTGVVVLAESHISIHTWPESGFAAVDIFMCGDAEPQRAMEVIQRALKPATFTLQTIARGVAE